MLRSRAERSQGCCLILPGAVGEQRFMDLVPYLHDGLNSAKACECVLFSKWDCLRTSYIDSLWSKFDFNQAFYLKDREACLGMPSTTPRMPHP